MNKTGVAGDDLSLFEEPAASACRSLPSVTNKREQACALTGRPAGDKGRALRLKKDREERGTKTRQKRALEHKLKSTRK